MSLVAVVSAGVRSVGWLARLVGRAPLGGAPLPAILAIGAVQRAGTIAPATDGRIAEVRR